MFDFEKFIERHGEVSAQALIENMERFEGIRNQQLKSLKERWTFVMHAPADDIRLAA